jgi:hypothetical protein
MRALIGPHLMRTSEVMPDTSELAVVRPFVPRAQEERYDHEFPRCRALRMGGVDQREQTMAAEPRRLAILREHFRWANGFALLWIIFTVLIFTGGSWLFDEMHGPESMRTPCAVLLATIVIVHAIWMAAGMALARLQEELERAEMRTWGSGLR